MKYHMQVKVFKVRLYLVIWCFRFTQKRQVSPSAPSPEGGGQAEQNSPDDPAQACRSDQPSLSDEDINAIVECLMHPPGAEPLDSSRRGTLTEIVKKLERHSGILERLRVYAGDPVRREFSVRLIHSCRHT